MRDQDIEARHAQVLGSGQRIAPLQSEQFPPEATDLSSRMRSTLDYADENPVHHYFATMAHHPDLFRCQMETGMLLLGKSAIPPDERELAVLRTAWLCRAPYEWAEHVALARRFGVSADEIAMVRQGSTAAGWDSHRRALLRAVEELLDDKAITDATWQTLAARWDAKQMIELPALVGQYHAVALVQNSLRIALNEGSEGLRAG
ncbi:MAG: carboxymuconolactone decarboxylase family protein [Sphingomonadales bacterium]|nr:carboxymuconolactone decarboxylase family protein [Sphingomonadales bacterium]